MAINIDKMHADMRWENRKFFIQVIVALAVVIGASVTLGTYIAPRSSTPNPPQIIYLVPSPPVPAK